MLLVPCSVEAQFFKNVFRGARNFFRPVMQMFHGHRGQSGGGGFGFGGGNRGSRPPGHSGPRDLDENGGTKKPEATGVDKTYPDDCGRDDKNKGKLCFPDGLLCQKSTRDVGNLKHDIFFMLYRSSTQRFPYFFNATYYYVYYVQSRTWTQCLRKHLRTTVWGAGRG